MDTPLQRGPIPSALLQTIYASDQAMYPAPLPYERLRSWVAACPDLSISFGESIAGDHVVVGVMIALPLVRSHWERLLSGELREADVDAEAMFPDGREGAGVVEVGVHVFHVERFEGPGVSRGGRGRWPRFAGLAVDEVVSRAALVGRWRVVGLSALTATDAGRKSFKRMGFTPTGYKEIFTVPDQAFGTAAMGAANNRQEIAGGNPGVQMVCVYPGEESVESGKSRLSGCHVISASEMTVRYMS
ncbi:hypothetical protein B0T25DRAFT_554941 [Lasiosphaeria hispida]|uniref:Uncharacterized protein n=1 Tax=Lasiosphaeria hispida TaxID=260671 RepID=A0AAJ0H8D6_9PEZI|nr:hypothetical protein B0T25DRAFT_554941 [Lasiosphaeria hispida]